jgi:hypothetical protein
MNTDRQWEEVKMHYTNRIYGVHSAVAFGVPLLAHVAALAALLRYFVFSAALGFSLLFSPARADSLPAMPMATAEASEDAPPEMPSTFEPWVSPDGSIHIHYAPPVPYWDVQYEWSPEPSFSNAVPYPGSFRVPFEHDRGFIRVVATKRPGRAPGAVGLPTERVALPLMIGRLTVTDWHRKEAVVDLPYNAAGFYEFNVPAWNRWYRLELADADGAVVFDKWIGHFLSGGE